MINGNNYNQGQTANDQKTEVLIRLNKLAEYIWKIL